MRAPHQQGQQQHHYVARRAADANPRVGVDPRPDAISPSRRQHSLDIHSPQPHDDTLRSAERAVSAWLLPPLVLLVVVSYLDRTALSFASLQMTADLGLSSSVYGLGSGAFFLSYAIGQLPANFCLIRFGGPTWLAAVCVAWGVAASCSALVRGPVSFVLLRMLLGLAEAGAVPGTWYYVTCFYPAARTTVPLTIIETGITVSQVIAAPLAAGLLMLDGKAGLRGWQHVFLLEGVPAVLLGCVIGWWLPASIQSAPFLSAAQREALFLATPAGAAAAVRQGSLPAADAVVDVAAEQHAGQQQQQDEDEAAKLLPYSRDSSSGGEQPHSPAPAGDATDPQQEVEDSSRLQHSRPSSAGAAAYSKLPVVSGAPAAAGGGPQQRRPGWRDVVAAARNRVVLYAGCWRVFHDIPGSGVLFWTPKIVQALLVAAAAGAGSGSLQPPAAAAAGPGVRIVLLSAVPYCAASLVHVVNAWHSQRVGEARLHIALVWLLGAAALCLLPFAAAGALGDGVAAAAGAAGSGVSSATVAAFVLLTLAHVGVNGANGLQTGLVAGCLPPGNAKALGLAAYNTIGCLGAFLGPLVIGVLHDATQGYSAAMWVLGACLAVAAAMVLRFRAPAAAAAG